MMDWFEKMFFGSMFSFFAMLMLATMIILFDVLTGMSCYSKSKIMNLEYNYGIFSGCMVKLDGTFVPMTNVVAVERDGKIVYVPNAPYRIDLNTKGNK